MEKAPAPNHVFLTIRISCIPLVLIFALCGVAADRVFTPDVSPAWAQQQDKAIRARLEQGDLDSMVNLLLFGTSFTSRPRVKIENLTEASKTGLVRARVNDLVAGLRSPGDNERLLFLRALLQKKGINLETADAGAFIYDQLLRDLKERRTYTERSTEGKPASLLDRGSLFQDRGLSLDTSILPDFSIEQTLRDLKQRGVLHEGGVTRVAVIGPGLDFIDKNDASAYDYYPQQSLQPFALYDSLVRLGLAQNNKISMSIFDINSRVIDHFEHARERAKKNTGYAIQLPRDIGRPWSPQLISYWSALGDRIGSSVAPIPPPVVLKGLQTRAVRIRPEVVLACEPVDLNIVVERLSLPAPEQFDLMIATNIFVYYQPSEQTLALENAGAMLKTGGLLLTNDRLPESPHGSMRQTGMTVVQFDDHVAAARDAMGWYQKR